MCAGGNRVARGRQEGPTDQKRIENVWSRRVSTGQTL